MAAGTGSGRTVSAVGNGVGWMSLGSEAGFADTEGTPESVARGLASLAAG